MLAIGGLDWSGGTIIGTSVLLSHDRGATWENLAGAPPGRVQDIRFDPFNHARILVALRGYGVAEYTRSGPLFNDGFETSDTSRWSETVR